MSTTLARPRVQSGRRDPGLRLEPVGHGRRPALAVGSLALVMTCVAVFISVYLRAGDQMSVLAIARSVPEGQVVRADDLKAVRISAGTTIATVPAAAASAVVGRRAAEALEPDTLLGTNELMTRFSPPSGESIVGVAAKDGQLPASGVAPGETVDVILTGQAGQQDASIGSAATGAQSVSSGAGTAAGEPLVAGTVLVSGATVLETATSPASSGSNDVDVSLLTPSPLAPIVASASAAGEIALVVVAPGS